MSKLEIVKRDPYIVYAFFIFAFLFITFIFVLFRSLLDVKTK